jgi:hypothetical protein
MKTNDGTTKTILIRLDTSGDLKTVTGEWQRFDFTATMTAASLSFQFLLWDATPGPTSDTADLLMWQAQLEAAPFASSDIPTTTVAVTRDADDLSTTLDTLSDSRTNLLTYSEQFDNAAWSLQGITVAANATTDSNGNAYADKLTEMALTAPHYSFQYVAKASSPLPYTFIVEVKAAERTECQIGITETGGANWGVVVLNLSSGAVSAVGTIGAGFSSTSVTVTDKGNGWWRVALSGTTGALSSVAGVVVLSNGGAANTTVASYLGDITKGIYVARAQLVAGSDPGAAAYLPTAATAITAARSGGKTRSLPRSFCGGLSETTQLTAEITQRFLSLVIAVTLLARTSQRCSATPLQSKAC